MKNFAIKRHRNVIFHNLHIPKKTNDIEIKFIAYLGFRICCNLYEDILCLELLKVRDLNVVVNYEIFNLDDHKTITTPKTSPIYSL